MAKDQDLNRREAVSSEGSVCESQFLSRVFENKAPASSRCPLIGTHGVRFMVMAPTVSIVFN